MLLAPSDWSLAQSSDVVLAGLSDELSAHTSPETHAGVVELATGVHHDVDGAVAELASLRSRRSLELDALGLTVAAAGTHPFTLREETEVSGAARYRALDDSLRVLARREPTMALHVHVGVPAPGTRFECSTGCGARCRCCSRCRPTRPSGRAAIPGSPRRARDLSGVPSDGAAAEVRARYCAYVEAVDALIASGALPDPSFLWWDVRLQPVLGTVEVRVMDAQSTFADSVAPLVALVQSLARLELEGDTRPVAPGARGSGREPFPGRSRRDGSAADRSAGRRLVPVRETLSERWSAECRPHGRRARLRRALDRVRGWRRQRGRPPARV